MTNHCMDDLIKCTQVFTTAQHQHLRVREVCNAQTSTWHPWAVTLLLRIPGTSVALLQRVNNHLVLDTLALGLHLPPLRNTHVPGPASLETPRTCMCTCITLRLTCNYLCSHFVIHLTCSSVTFLWLTCDVLEYPPKGNAGVSETVTVSTKTWSDQ